MNKIIFIHLLNDYSGSPKVLSQVIKITQNHHIPNELFTGRNNNGFLSGVTNRHYYFFYKRFENKYLTLITYTLSQFILFFKLLKYHNEDIVFYVNTLLPFGAAIAGKFMNKPVIYHIHEISIKPKLLKDFLRFIVQICASKIIFVSAALKNHESFADKKEIIIYNALTENFKQKGNAHIYSMRNGGLFNAMMVCSLKTYKGILEFIDIAKISVNIPSISFTLILNADQAEIETFFKTIQLPNNLTIVTRQKDLIPFYEKANVLLNLSRVDECIETFGLTIIEAMAFGIPVIVPPIGGPAEIVTNGLEGYCISSYNTQAIAQKIIELSQNENLCYQLSQNSRKRCDDFSEMAFEQQIIKVLNDNQK